MFEYFFSKKNLDKNKLREEIIIKYYLNRDKLIFI